LPALVRTGTAELEGSSTAHGGVCTHTWYRSSKIERLFLERPNELTANKTILCKVLNDWNYLHTWLGRHTSADIQNADDSVFPTMCRAGSKPQRLEPLAGILRDPRYQCKSKDFKKHTDYLVVANRWDFQPESDGRRLFFDAGGSVFTSTMWFLELYASKGLPMDEIFIWEAREISDKAYWKGTSAQIRRKWQPKLTRNNGVPVVDGVGAADNPMTLIYKKCRPQDFCVFKLDIDAPLIENKIAAQLLENPGNLKEFFYEHHVFTPVMGRVSVEVQSLTLRDSYELFLRLREKGIRAHSWI